MKKEIISQKAIKLWRTYKERDPRQLCKYLDIQILNLPMGFAVNSIKGLIVKQSRCYCIVINSDISAKERDFIIFHEIGHWCLGHADKSTCSFRDVEYQTSKDEIEANEFVAEYLLDNDETLAVLQEVNSFYDAASILHVPDVIMDYKLRMLRYYHLISSECPIYHNSDCMGHLKYNVCESDFDA